VGHYFLSPGLFALSHRFKEGPVIFRFASREAFLTYLWLVPVVIVVGMFIAKRAAKKIEGHLGSRLTPFLTSSISTFKRRCKLTLEILTLVFFVIAMARPQMGSSLQEVKSEGLEIMFLLDVSRSMMAEDNKPNRLELVKVELKRLLDRLSGDKVGLVIFAGSSFLVSPLTNDYSALKLYLDSVSTESVSSQGTEIKPALETAMEAFKRGGVGDEEGVAVTRVILVASDGEDHDQGALAEAKKLHGQGVSIFSLGAGTEQGAPIPLRDDQGYLRGYVKDKSGKVVNSQHHGDFLTSLAVAAGGGYYHVSNSSSVDQLKARFDKLQKAQFESSLATEYDERFQIFLLMGILLAMVELFLGERKSTGPLWRGRLGGMGGGGLALLILIFPPRASAVVTPDVISKNNAAVELLKGKQAYQAYHDITELLSNAPFQPEVRLNLAYAYELNEEYDKAIQEYLSVAGSGADDKLKFEAEFNAARLYGEKQKVPEALEHYQKALDIDPTSAEAKTNIELLLKSQNGGGQKGDQKKDQKDQNKEQNKGGQGDKDNKDKKEPDKPQPNANNQQKRAPRPFKSEELSDRDAKNILEELKRQEEKNRAKVLDKPAKENTSGPDW
jgi:Ca-activated chloride channel family protein